jgi:hypothetical protein
MLLVNRWRSDLLKGKMTKKRRSDHNKPQAVQSAARREAQSETSAKILKMQQLETAPPPFFSGSGRILGCATNLHAKFIKIFIKRNESVLALFD